ncbi:MAG: hypothetical protein Q8Q08_11715 [Candidatus Omnitrophota bacterium]|nr:hypothetical protein [Candidatus Omnitrophota bacterium]
MVTNLSISNSKKLPWPFIASLLLFTLLQVGLDRCPAFWRYAEHNYRFHSDDALRLVSVLRRIPPDASFKKVLMIGTSQGREGIDFDVLNAHFSSQNIRFYDLGVIGNFHPIDLYMLKDRILATKPDVVVYSPHVETFYAPYKLQPANNLEYYFNPNIIPGLAKHLRWEDYDKDFRGDLLDSLIGSFSLFYKFRNHFDSVFFTSLQYSLGVVKRPEQKMSFFTKPYDGSYYKRQIESKQENPRYRYTRYTDLYQELFTIFVRDVASRNIKFIVLSCPLHPLFPKICSPQVMAAYQGFLADQSRQTGFTYTPNKELPVFTAGEFNDFTHLTLPARKRFTQFLIGYFERELKDLQHE